MDVVLNSLTGAAQRAGLELLAFGGRFVEIGKRDVYEHTRVDLYPFRRNLVFYYADLMLMSHSAPEADRRTAADGLRPGRRRRAAGARTLRVAAGRGRHRDPRDQRRRAHRQADPAHPARAPTDVAVPPTRAKVFRKDGSYIVTGGVGGLGLFLAAMMASAGCGRIVLTSRSQPNPQAQKTIARLRSNGADIVVECGNIADARTAARLVCAATATGLPLRGVLHAAAVVDDATIGNITDELIDRDWSPKVFGAWYLHQATAGQPLDWFCSFSSAAALLGSPGQGAYAAANSWLDAFTAWQRSHGLPGTAIAWGAWAQIGRGAGLAQRGDTTMISPNDGGHAFRALLRYDRGYTGYLPLTGMPWLTALAARSPFAETFRAAEFDADASAATVLAELARCRRRSGPTACADSSPTRSA